MLLNCGAGEDSWESLGQQGDQSSQSERKSTLNIHWKYLCWSWSSNTLATGCKEPTIGKDPDAGKDWGQEENGMAEDEMVEWHHRLNGHEFEQTQGDSERQGNLVHGVAKSQIQLSDWTTAKIVASGPITSWQRDGEKLETWQIFFSWAPKSLQMVTAASILEDICSLEGKLWQT